MGDTSDRSRDDELHREVEQVLGAWGLSVSPADRRWLLSRARAVAADARLLAAVAGEADEAMTIAWPEHEVRS